jgi:DNA 3'-phosphatase
MSSSSSIKRRPDPPGASPPAQKKARQQSSLLSFFDKKKEDKGGDPPGASLATVSKVHLKEFNDTSPSSVTKIASEASLPINDIINESSETKQESQKKNDALSDARTSDTEANPLDPIVPQTVSLVGRWKVVQQCLLVRTADEPPRNKVCALDLDGTLLNWRISGWPSQLHHYELWNASLISKLRQLHDKQGYKLCVFSNQGAIKSALTGKKATLVKSLLDWLAHTLDRPLFAVCSTDKKKGFHKPSVQLWTMAERECNQGIEFNVSDSFYVGDSVVSVDDAQGGVDEKFAQNVRSLRGAELKFYTPEQCFGVSTAQQRRSTTQMINYYPPPSLKTRAALLGGYLKKPVLLLLCGVQGAGKSTFCHLLGDQWVCLSQDTIRQGKSGTRQQVEQEVRRNLEQSKCVAVDRMNLTKEQRSHFLALKVTGCQVHIIVLNPPKDIIAERVKARTNHQVVGDKGVRLALSSLQQLQLPTYDEQGVDLISCTATNEGMRQLAQAYRHVAEVFCNERLETTVTLSNGIVMPRLGLGTMGLANENATKIVAQAIALGVQAVDTAPTYKNEVEIGRGMSDDTFCIVKIPKRAIAPQQVREELMQSLMNLGRKRADLLLLHWPSDVMEAGTLSSVWKEMETCVGEGHCRALGVCNFNVCALSQLLPSCSIPPAVNQVERHPVLPQWELLDFCLQHGIQLQAHTPLGQGKLLQHQVVLEVARECNCLAVQVLLRWNLQQFVCVLPKCSSAQHLEDVLREVPALTADQMRKLDSIEGHKRFVSPLFMFAKKGTPYAWGERKKN